MHNLTIYDASGVLGSIIFLGAYAALQLGFLRGEGYAYAAFNALGAGFVLASIIQDFNLATTILQSAWISISVVGIARYYILTRRARFSDEERAFLASALPAMDKHKARRLLDLGTWIDGEPNTVLTDAGIPVPYLVYLARGSADVYTDDRLVASIGERSFIGEMTALSGDAATATVILAERSRYLAIPAEPLRRLLARDDGMRRELDMCLARDIKEKLVRSNRARFDTSPATR